MGATSMSIWHDMYLWWKRSLSLPAVCKEARAIKRGHVRIMGSKGRSWVKLTRYRLFAAWTERSSHHHSSITITAVVYAVNYHPITSSPRVFRQQGLINLLVRIIVTLCAYSLSLLPQRCCPIHRCPKPLFQPLSTKVRLLPNCFQQKKRLPLLWQERN